MNTEASLGKKLAVLAKLKGLTQEQIAKACAMSRISVNRFFRSHTEIRAGDLGAMLSTLGINLDEMIDSAIERQIRGSHIFEDPIQGEVAKIVGSLDDLRKRTLLDQVKFWAQSLKSREALPPETRLATGT
jgi:transcriptional regulator with XRE-family HTH domain